MSDLGSVNLVARGGHHKQVDSGRIFLTAEWRDLVLLNYEVDPGLLVPYVPRGTELDYWNSKAFVSLVGFRFVNTKVFGVPIPLHSNFTEANLRFYVRRREQGEVRRGVVFIREIVPRPAIALVARTFYNENYVTLPMTHTIEKYENGSSQPRTAGAPAAAGARCALSRKAMPNW
jgi:uncharacterized protein YqjF (DUF2071 family)